eukprot:scaffold184_cov125-Cylindrotheca_fusiformis.AAC.2
MAIVAEAGTPQRSISFILSALLAENCDRCMQMCARLRSCIGGATTTRTTPGRLWVEHTVGRSLSRDAFVFWMLAAIPDDGNKAQSSCRSGGFQNSGLTDLCHEQIRCLLWSVP